MNGMIHDKPIKSEELEQILQTWNTPQGASVQWETIAGECLRVSDDFLNNAYDNHQAITWFNHAIKLCEELKLEQIAAQAYIGIALAYHNIGKNDQRDACMAKAQQLLNIPNDTHLYHQGIFNPMASNYFVVDGYRYYIKYEQAQRNRESLTTQEKHLQDGEYAFQKAIAIADLFTQKGVEKSHAIHGLGTIFEFLAKCQKERNNQGEFIVLLQESINRFTEAAALREKLLGPNHPHVARSFHKLARNYDLLSDAQNDPQLLRDANEYYQKSLKIFAQSKVPQLQAKRQELEKEYELFQKKLKNY